MFGTIVNTLAIVLCAVIGALCGKRIPARFEDGVKSALGLAILFIGLKGAFESRHTLLLIFSMVIGGAVGEIVDIDRLMNRTGAWLEGRLKMDGGAFAKGFVSASVLFCSGSMAIVGAIQSGLQGDHSTLYAKSILDGSISIVFAASMGIGVVFSAVSVFLYQGSIALLSMAVKDFLTADMVNEMSAAGNLLVAGIGINFLSPRQIKVANLIPAIFVPIIYFVLPKV